MNTGLTYRACIETSTVTNTWVLFKHEYTLALLTEMYYPGLGTQNSHTILIYL